MKREYYCGHINQDSVGSKVKLYGWVQKKREMGGLTFFDLRDRSGIVQVVINENFPHADLTKKVGREWVLEVLGTVALRSNPNPDIPTGKFEIMADSVNVLAESAVPPFFPDSKADVSDEIRFQYRYIDLRSRKHQENFRLRSRVSLAIRNYLDQHGFLEIETPILTKSTPEGARDYLVPSRVYKGRVFALPQSPQQFKQLLMISGFERYFQLARCFRDEDLRADRQPEFTQVDIETSFMEPEELFSVIEGMMAHVFKLADIEVSMPFSRMTHAEAMNRFGSDKPDLRIPFEIADFSAEAGKLGSNILDSVLNSGGEVRGIVLPDSASYSRKKLDQINDFVRQNGGQGVIWVKKNNDVFKASLKADSQRLEKLFENSGISSDKILFLIAGEKSKILPLLGRLRLHLGAGMADPGKNEFLWVTDFPLFFFNEEENRLDSNHHPFTCPREEDLAMLKEKPLEVKSVAYDLVLNGVEIGGGSKRISSLELQHTVFSLLGLEEQEIREKFGYFLDALKFGAPPHMGIALGLDRILMLMTGAASIRELIAFPKTTSSLCLLTGSPSKVPDRLLTDLGIRIIDNK